METFYSGSLTIEIEEDGQRDGRDRFKGRIILQDGREWPFDELCSAVGGARTVIDMAGSALSFASYYSTDNRGDDVPEWAPPGDLASAIGDAADITPEELPEGQRIGRTNEDESVYWGELYTVFDSKESQDRWFKVVNEMDEKRGG